jgi:hypothetical protein
MVSVREVGMRGNVAVVRTLGIDLAAQPASTGACEVEWRDGRARARVVDGLLDDDCLVALAGQADVVGIDVPLGWPDAFVATVAAHHRPAAAWPPVDPGWPALRYRRTDLAVAARTGVRPLSVSSDLIAVCAFRGAVLQRRLAAVWGEPAVSRSGEGRLVEVYPAGALRTWGLPARGYKRRTGAALRETIVAQVTSRAPWLDIDPGDLDRCRRRDHDLDALVAALAARAAAVGASTGPGGDDLDAARREGWIHLPTVDLDGLGACRPGERRAGMVRSGHV